MSVRAPLERRIRAFLVDALAAASLALLSALAAYGASAHVKGAPGMIMALACVLFGVLASSAYVLVRDALGEGMGAGKRLMRVRVVRSDGSRCDYTSSIIRNSTLLVPVLGQFDLFVGALDRGGLRLGDRLAGTQVVE